MILIYHLLDWFFVVFHTLLVLFNAIGWAWRPTRKLNLLTLVLTGASWFLLGIFYGIGYCFLTDWHWWVLRRLGEADLPNSYIQYLLDRVAGLTVTAWQANLATVAGFAIAVVASVWLTYHDWRQEKRQEKRGQASSQR